ncbi:MAG: hypothetical protein HY451_01740 [Parcubacteria group bacterium]|nr:hypothetical protein [Parcubacteria group bacterium]
MIHDIIGSFNRKKVLLIGDTILDVYIYGKIVGQALDAPVPEVEEENSRISFGGNALVASNILALGGTVFFISVIGADDDAKYYDLLKHPRLKKIFLVDKTRKTTVKRRWFADGKKLLQVNNVDNHAIGKNLEKKVGNLAGRYLSKADVMVVMDPQHGLLTKNLIKHLLRLSRKYKKPFYVDAQISHRKSNHHLYKGVDCMFLNEKEAREFYPRFDFTKPEKSLDFIRKKLNLDSVVVKQGKHGSLALFNGAFIKNKALKVNAVDVCGAGDAFLAAASLGDKRQPEDTLKISNFWASLSTTVHGTIPPRKKDLIKAL